MLTDILCSVAELLSLAAILFVLCVVCFKGIHNNES